MNISINEIYKGNIPWLINNTVYLTKYGSHAYGTNTPESDLDIRGICIPPKEYHFGCIKNFEQAEAKDPDLVIFNIKKFFNLAAQANPSILEILYTDESDWIYCNKFGRTIIENRDLFISKKVKFSFTGYAVAQLKRIQLHRRYILNPVVIPPTRKEFGLPETTLIPGDQLGAAQEEIKKKIEEWDINWSLIEPAERINIQNKLSLMLAECKLTTDELYISAARSIGFNDNFIDYLKKEKAYKRKKDDYDSYQNWKKNRNPKRAILEEKCHYDPKHASHLVRLIRLAKEILTTGKVIVKRPDAEELLAIKNGAWTYEQILEYAEKEEKELDEIYKTCNMIPHSPNVEKINELCMNIVEEFLYG